jgi:hypothetical protein
MWVFLELKIRNKYSRLKIINTWDATNRSLRVLPIALCSMPDVKAQNSSSLMACGKKIF